MSNYYVHLVFVVLLDLFKLSCAITHWIVTEEGTIQGQLNSIYLLKRPYDLVALLNQEKLAENASSHYNEMVQRKTVLDNKWSRIFPADKLEQDLATYDVDCKESKESVSNEDLLMNVIDYAQDAIKEQKLPVDKRIHGNASLDCRIFSPLDFSMATFPHLKIMYHSWNLTWPKEIEIVLPFTVKQLHYGLQVNKTSWYLYNLASLYWRSKGNSKHAFDCIKRSIHFAPRRYKDTPLFNFGVMLHRTQVSAEAAIILHSAIDHAPRNMLAHFVLGNAYAVMGDYNRSVACYNNVLGIDPSWFLVRTIRHSIACHGKLKDKLLDLERSVHDVLVLLKEFQKLEEEWLKFYDEIFRQHDASGRSVPLEGESDDKSTEDNSTKNDREEACEIKPNINLKGHKMEGDLVSLKEIFSVVEAKALEICKKNKDLISVPAPPGVHKLDGEDDEYFVQHWDPEHDDLSTFYTDDHCIL